MKWTIPAKTFLLGEYAALANASALLVTTTPYFALSLEKQREDRNIHPHSPAGLWWQKQNITEYVLSWNDPYHSIGGLGASSAQFIGSYLASCLLKNETPTLDKLLAGYYQCAWNGTGLKPSGYDVIAQTQSGCVYINKERQHISSYPWLFKDLSFFLIHTGIKLATHHHLQQTDLPAQIPQLSTLVDTAKKAFEQGHSELFIQCINDYHHQLARLNLVAEHSLELIGELKKHPEVLAIKGCGALGADIILLITSPAQANSLREKLLNSNKKILATEANVASRSSTLIESA